MEFPDGTTPVMSRVCIYDSSVGGGVGVGDSLKKAVLPQLASGSSYMEEVHAKVEEFDLVSFALFDCKALFDKRFQIYISLVSIHFGVLALNSLVYFSFMFCFGEIRHVGENYCLYLSVSFETKICMKESSSLESMAGSGIHS